METLLPQLATLESELNTLKYQLGDELRIEAKAANDAKTQSFVPIPPPSPSVTPVANESDAEYADPTENSATELPKLEPDGNGNLRFTYTANPGATSLQFLIEKSTVLGGSWSTHTPAPQDIAITPLSATQERRTVTLPMPASGSTFYRLSVRTP